MKVLITGVGGFIGSNLAAAHLAAGDQVIGIDNFSTGNQGNLSNLQGLELIEGGVSENLGEVTNDVKIAYHFEPDHPETVSYTHLTLPTKRIV